MRSRVRRAAVVVAILVAAPSIAWFAFPAADDDAEGPADPLLAVRRPVVRTLRAIGVLPDDAFVDPWLPSEERGPWTWYGPDGASSDGRLRVRREPVYRGILWHVGTRVVVEQEVRAGARGVRIVRWSGATASTPHRHEPAEPGRRLRDADVPGFDVWTCTAFVPHDRGWDVEVRGEDGRWRTTPFSGWTRTPP